MKSGKLAAVKRFLVYTLSMCGLFLLPASFEGESYIQFSRLLDLSSKTLYEAFSGTYTAPEEEPPVYEEAVILKYRRILYYDERVSDPSAAEYDEELRQALIAFQFSHNMTQTGELDEETTAVLDRYEPTFKQGMEGEEIQFWQTKLVAAEYLDPSLADGKFGDGTYLAVIHFQEDNGLILNGYIDEETRAKLIEAEMNFE